MPFIVGGFAAMVALAAGILARVDPFTSLWRALLALALGWIGTSMWQAVVTIGKQAADTDHGQASTGGAETS